MEVIENYFQIGVLTCQAFIPMTGPKTTKSFENQPIRLMYTTAILYFCIFV
jgi:hypothetical protein